jgi:hypothetical protein
MRKIEAQMIMAVRDQLSGSEKTWRSGNTEVSTEHAGIYGTFNYERDVVVRLHDNEIARFDSMLHGDRTTRGLRITDAGWQTVTTKSRLNALLDCFYEGQGINQVKGVWLLNSTEFAGTDWVSYGWRDNWACQQAEAITKPAVKASGSVYDVEWRRAMASTLAMAKVAATATVLA